MTGILISEDKFDVQVLEVTKQLISYGIPIEQWGIGKVKTVEHLVKEILEREAVLVDKKGEIIRKVELVHIDIRYRVNSIELQLVEDRQEFKDGRERRRGLTGISEKMKLGEDPLATARRALAEELGLQCVTEIADFGTEEEAHISPSYPGLTTEYLRHEMGTYLPDSSFNQSGYIENQPDKSTFFVWKEV